MKTTASDFLNRFAGEPWCRIDERPKLRQAFLVLCSRMPTEVFENLPKIITITPLPKQDAFTMRAPEGLTEKDAAIFIPPHYEDRSQAENDFMLAHEFAHTALKHHQYPRFDVWTNEKEYFNIPTERDADELAAK
jgi:hypothetical protein